MSSNYEYNTEAHSLTMKDYANELLCIPMMWTDDINQIMVMGKYIEFGKEMNYWFTLRTFDTWYGRAVSIEGYNMTYRAVRGNTNYDHAFTKRTVDTFPLVGARDLIMFRIFPERGSFRFAIEYPDIYMFQTIAEYVSYYSKISMEKASDKNAPAWKQLAKRFQLIKRTREVDADSQFKRYCKHLERTGPATTLEKFIKHMEKKFNWQNGPNAVITVASHEMRNPKPYSKKTPHLLIEDDFPSFEGRTFRLRKICEIGGMTDEEAIDIILDRISDEEIIKKIKYSALKATVDQFHPERYPSRNILKSTRKAYLEPEIREWLES